MDMDLKKVFWVIVAVVTIGVLAAYIVSPTVAKTKAQKSAIENVNFTDGTGASVSGGATN